MTTHPKALSLRIREHMVPDRDYTAQQLGDALGSSQASTSAALQSMKRLKLVTNEGRMGRFWRKIH